MRKRGGGADPFVLPGSAPPPGDGAGADILRVHSIVGSSGVHGGAISAFSGPGVCAGGGCALLSRTADVLFLCHPNNPTGRLVDPVLRERIVEQCRRQGTRLFVDECFLDLSDQGREASFQSYLLDWPGLFLLKAFTKSYAMAGLRLGYGISADRALLAQMSRMVQAWNVSLPAQKAGVAALGEDAYLAEARKLIVQERAYLERALREYLGARICPSQANYMLFYCDRPLYEALLEQGILIRRCANYPGLGQGWYRIAVKRPEENRLLVAALRRIAEEE